MKPILPKYVIISFFVGLSIYIFQNTGVLLPKLINNYLNDFLIIPIVLFLSLKVLRWSRNDKSYKISLGVILYISAFYAIVFELLLPKINQRYTADVIDVILYFAGGVVFYQLQIIDGYIKRQNK